MPPPSFRVRPEEGGDFFFSDPSIAVSVVVTPSRTAKLICLNMSALLFGLSIALWGFAAPELFLSARMVLSGFAFICAFAVFREVMISRHPVCLDISGQGQVRLSQQEKAAVTSSDRAVKDENCLFQFQPHTVIFSSLLLLRLKNDKDQKITLLIFRDCVSSSAFRRLSVACRWIAVQNYRA
jgi:toxin CptA